VVKLYLELLQASIAFERMTVGEAITEWERFQPEGTYAARADMQGLREVADAPDDRAREREPDKECPMKRSTFDGEAIVYRYGCPHWADLDEAGLRQLRLAHNLWNELVAGELQHEETVRQLWAQHPEVGETLAVVTVAEEALTKLLERTKSEHVKDRSTRTRVETKSAVAEARRELRETRAVAKAAKKSAYAEMEPLFAEVKQAQRDAQRAFYGTYTGQGLYWAMWNDVLQRFQTTLQTIATQRRAGRPATVRFHRWTGEGTLTVQLQRQTGDPARTPSILLSPESKWKNVFVPPECAGEEWPERCRPAARPNQGRGNIRIRMGQDEQGAAQFAEIPVQMHRPLPSNGDVTLVRLTRKRIAGQYRLYFTITVRTERPAERSEGHAIAWNFGWRRLEDGSVRVGTFEASGTPAEPFSFGSPMFDEIVRVRDAGRSGEVVIPASWIEVIDKQEAIASLRSTSFDEARAVFATALVASPELVEALGVVPGDVSKWRSPSRLAAAVLRWRDLDDSLKGDALTRLEAWRRQDRHLWEWVANERNQLLARRRNVYRVIAAAVSDRFGTIVLDDADYRALARRPVPEEEDAEMARRSRAMRVLVAPGELRDALNQAAKRRGVPVDVHSAAGLTSIHETCGSDLSERSSADFAGSTRVWCATCEKSFDQDSNAAKNLLARLVDNEPGAKAG
jgi:hypothetical protein